MMSLVRAQLGEPCRSKVALLRFLFVFERNKTSHPNRFLTKAKFGHACRPKKVGRAFLCTKRLATFLSPNLAAASRTAILLRKSRRNFHFALFSFVETHLLFAGKFSAWIFCGCAFLSNFFHFLTFLLEYAKIKRNPKNLR